MQNGLKRLVTVFLVHALMGSLYANAETQTAFRSMTLGHEHAICNEQVLSEASLGFQHSPSLLKKVPVLVTVLAVFMQTTITAPLARTQTADSQARSKNAGKIFKRAAIVAGEVAAITLLSRNAELRPILFADLINGAAYGFVSARRYHHPMIDGVLWGTSSRLITFGGKTIVEKTLDKQPALTWLGRAVHGTGDSMLTNMVRGKDPFHEVEFGFAPFAFNVRLRRDVGQKGRFSFGVDPLAVGTIAANLMAGNQFDARTSLRIGTPVFLGRGLIPGSYAGFDSGGVITMDPKYRPTGILNHEMVHVLQDEDSRPAGVFLADRLYMRGWPRWLPMEDNGGELLTFTPQLTLPYASRPYEEEAYTWEHATGGISYPRPTGWSFFGSQLPSNVLVPLGSTWLDHVLPVALIPRRVHVESLGNGAVKVSWFAPEESLSGITSRYIAKGSYSVTLTGPNGFISVLEAGQGSSVVFRGLPPSPPSKPYQIEISHSVRFSTTYRSSGQTVVKSKRFYFTLPKTAPTFTKPMRLFPTAA